MWENRARECADLHITSESRRDPSGTRLRPATGRISGSAESPCVTHRRTESDRHERSPGASLSDIGRVEGDVGLDARGRHDRVSPDRPQLRRRLAVPAFGRNRVPVSGCRGRTPRRRGDRADLANLGRAPLGIETDQTFRISVAGAQEKTALLRHGERWKRPVGTTPTTYILKPQIPEPERPNPFADPGAIGRERRSSNRPLGLLQSLIILWRINLTAPHFHFL